MRVFFNAIFVQIILSTYVLWRGWNALPRKKVIRAPFIAVFIAELIIYFIGYFFSQHLPFAALHYFAWVGTSWMIFIIYMSALLMLYDLMRFVDMRRKVLPRSVNLGKLKERLTYYCCSLILVLSAMAYGSYRFHNPVVTQKNWVVNKDARGMKHLRIVMASDIHAGFLIDKDVLGMYMDKIMEQNPDVIVLVGDLIDYDLASVKMHNMQEEFRRLKAPYGVYASTGNHDYIQLDDEIYGEKVDWLTKEAGLTMLRDTAVLVNNSFYLVGREDDNFHTRKPINDLVAAIDKSYPVIILNHEPHRLQEDADAGADIALYGHTHNGQFFPVNIPLKFMYELPYGYMKKDNTHIYVSSGLGLAGPQYRIGTVSEVVVLDVTFEAP